MALFLRVDIDCALRLQELGLTGLGFGPSGAEASGWLKGPCLLLVQYGPQQLPILSPHIPNVAIVSCTSNGHPNDIGNPVGLHVNSLLGVLGGHRPASTQKKKSQDDSAPSLLPWEMLLAGEGRASHKPPNYVCFPLSTYTYIYIYMHVYICIYTYIKCTCTGLYMYASVYMYI